jgi:hypothetical protein
VGVVELLLLGFLDSCTLVVHSDRFAYSFLSSEYVAIRMLLMSNLRSSRDEAAVVDGALRLSVVRTAVDIFLANEEDQRKKEWNCDTHTQQQQKTNTPTCTSLFILTSTKDCYSSSSCSLWIILKEFVVYVHDCMSEWIVVTF